MVGTRYHPNRTRRKIRKAHRTRKLDIEANSQRKSWI